MTFGEYLVSTRIGNVNAHPPAARFLHFDVPRTSTLRDRSGIVFVSKSYSALPPAARFPRSHVPQTCGTKCIARSSR